jgi:hypothetical protein
MTEVTGRDHFIMCKALAYAIVAIGRLPKEWQEQSDREDMLALLRAMARQPDYFLTCAQSNLERRDLVVKDGQFVLAGRDGDVVPIK